MDQKIHLAPFRLERVEGAVELVVLLDIARHHQDRIAGNQPAQPLGLRLALIGEGELGAMRLQRARDAPGDGMVVGDPHDEAATALHQIAGCLGLGQIAHAS
jgi:hypothetical protein